MASSTSTCSSDTLCAAVSREPCALLVAQRALAPPPPARAPRPTARRPRTSASRCSPCTRCRACVCLCCVVSGCGWLGLGWVGLVRALNVMVGARAQRGGVLNVVAFSTWWQRRVPRGALESDLVSILVLSAPPSVHRGPRPLPGRAGSFSMQSLYGAARQIDWGPVLCGPHVLQLQASGRGVVISQLWSPQPSCRSSKSA